jgi:cytochrome c oxidase cbb3-type subunit 1
MLLKRFAVASIIYYLIGTFWMATHRYLPAPTQGPLPDIYSGLWIHLLTVGWLSLLAIGVIYYLLPTALNKRLFSERLGNVHFWLTNIFLILYFITGIVMVFSLEPLLLAKIAFPEAMRKIMPLPIILDLVGWIGWAVQLLFAYNIARTLASK